MKRIATALAALLATAAVHAEIYQWKDESGKTVMSDKPPVSNAQQQRKFSSDVPQNGGAAQATTADREIEFRKRQKAAQEKAEKAGKEQSAAAENKENCDRSRRYLQSLESGERISFSNDKGERSYMEDAQRDQEIVKTRQKMQSNCK